MKVTLIEPKSPGKHVFSTVNMPRLGLLILGTLAEIRPSGTFDWVQAGIYICPILPAPTQCVYPP